MTLDRPYSAACERNRAPILEVLREWLPARCRVLEIGSGTGQHAAYFCREHAGWHWQCSDLPDNLPGISRWISELPPGRCPRPVALDVKEKPWLEQRFESVFTANSLHIMSWSSVQALFAGLPDVLEDAGQLIVYGPFKYAGEFTSPSNAQFDAQLRASAPHQGIRDIEAVSELASHAGLRLTEDRAMPANNRLLRYQGN